MILVLTKNANSGSIGSQCVGVKWWQSGIKQSVPFSHKRLSITGGRPLVIRPIDFTFGQWGWRRRAGLLLWFLSWRCGINLVWLILVPQRRIKREGFLLGPGPLASVSLCWSPSQTHCPATKASCQCPRREWWRALEPSAASACLLWGRLLCKSWPTLTVALLTSTWEMYENNKLASIW